MGVTSFESNLSAETCEARVRERTEVDAGFFSDFVFKTAILCRSTDHGLRLRVRNPWKGNAFTPRYFLKFRPIIGGTRIEMRSNRHPYPVIFMFVWFCGVVGVGGFMMILSILTLMGAKTRATGSPIAGIVGPLLMFGFGMAFVEIGRRVGVVEEAEIVSFLMNELGGRDATVLPNKTLQTDDAPRRR
jgi:hypothetical protein